MLLCNMHIYSTHTLLTQITTTTDYLLIELEPSTIDVLADITPSKLPIVLIICFWNDNSCRTCLNNLKYNSSIASEE